MNQPKMHHWVYLKNVFHQKRTLCDSKTLGKLSAEPINTECTIKMISFKKTKFKMADKN